MNQFRAKTYGRILVADEGLLPDVIAILSQMDAYEVERYMPEGFVTGYNPHKALDQQVIYGHKFDQLNLNDVAERCWQRGIWVLCLTGYSDPSKGV